MSELGPTVTELEPTAIERLRALLAERGVEWRGGLPTETMVEADGLDLLYVVLPDGRVRAFIRNYLTPEQAVAATLGAGTCHNASKVMDEHGQARFACSECGAWIDSRMLWNPEYRNGESPWVKDCKLNFCPNCGRRIVDPTTNDVDGKVDA